MTGNRVAIDTNVAVAALNGQPRVLQWLQDFDEVLLPVAVLAELRFGALSS